MDEEKDEHELEVPYEEGESDTASTNLEGLKKSLHVGKVLEEYKDVISYIKIKEVYRKVKDNPVDARNEKAESIYGILGDVPVRA